MSSIALVIFFVDSTLRILRRRIRSWPPAIALARLASGRALRARVRRRRRLLGGLRALGRPAGAGEAGLHLVDRRVERGRVWELAGLADLIEQLRMLGPQVRPQLPLEAPHVLDGNVVA